MSSNDPTFTLSMSSNKPTSLCPSSNHVDHCWHSFFVHCQTLFRWSLSITTPSTWCTSWFSLCNKVCVLQEMVLAYYVWNFPIFKCKWISYMFASREQQPL
jgi:hypothetical protein